MPNKKPAPGEIDLLSPLPDADAQAPVAATQITETPKETKAIQAAPQAAIQLNGDMDYRGMAKQALTLEKVEIFERVIAAQERWEDRQSEKAFNTAMVLMQAEIPILPKTEHVYYKTKRDDIVDYWHAQYDKMMETLQPLLTKYGFSVNYSSPLNPHIASMIHVECIISHIMGHSKTYHSDIPIANSMGNSTQNMGGTKFYGRRYSLSDALNLSFKKEDNDAQRKPSPNQALSQEQQAEIRGFVKSKDVYDNVPMWNYLGVKKGRYDLIPANRFDEFMGGLRKKFGAS